MSKRTMVYQYGCPHWVDFDEPAIEQLRKANRLWNDLVELDRNYTDVEQDILSMSFDVAVAEAEVERKNAAVDACVAKMKQHRQQARTTRPDDDCKAELKTARQERASANAQLKAVKKTVRAESAVAIKVVREARRDSIKAARQHAAADGLFWGTYNDILQRRFPLAVNKVIDRRKNGQRAELRFKRFDGSGTLTAQIMSQTGGPTPTIQRLTEDGWGTAAKFDINGKHAVLTVRIAKDDIINIPFVYHRPIPADAEIKEIKMSRRRTGTQWRVSLAVCVRLPAVPERTGGSHVGVVLKRKLDPFSTGDLLPSVVGGTTVAIVTSDQVFPPPPADVKEVVEISPNQREVAVYYSAEWRRVLDRDDDIRGIRDQNLDSLRNKIVDELKNDSRLVDKLGVTATDVARWRSPARFVRLSKLWPTRHPLADVFADWGTRDRHLWDYECHERQQTIAKRDDAWRKIAAWLLHDAKTIIIDATDLAELKKVPDVTRIDPQPARERRSASHAAAPGAFRAALVNAAAMRGVELITQGVDVIYMEKG